MRLLSDGLFTGQEAVTRNLDTLASSKFRGRESLQDLKLTFSEQSSNYSDLKNLLTEMRVSIVEVKCKVSDLHNDRISITLITYLL